MEGRESMNIDSLLKGVSPLEKAMLFDQYKFPNMNSGETEIKKFKQIMSRNIIDPAGSPSYTRAFYIPFLTPKYNKYNKYTVYEHVK